jgi:hypothetical protein
MRPPHRGNLPAPEHAALVAAVRDAPRYPHPKVLVIEAPETASVLRDRGFAVDLGTFGHVQSVPVKSGYWPVVSDDSLPGHTEKEVVIVDLAARPEVRGADESSLPQSGAERLWAPVFGETIDPRPLAMRREQAVMDRIYGHGGAFVVFTAAHHTVNYVIGTHSEYLGLDVRGEVLASNWDLLDELDYLSVTADAGEEMYPADNGLARTLGLDGYFTDGHFQCVIQPSGMLKGRWVTLAVSKFDLPVAGLIFPERDQEPKGWIFILPQMKRPADVVAHLVERVLPVLAPHLFPDSEGSSWTRLPEYQLPRIAELRSEISAVEEASRQRVRELEEQIEIEREQFAFLDELLTASGSILVRAVIRTLRFLGFSDVHDVDTEAEAAGDNGPRREDIRIMDT